jgi:hypothetical protein
VRDIACAGSDLIVKKLRDDNAHVHAAESSRDALGNPTSHDDLSS